MILFFFFVFLGWGDGLETRTGPPQLVLYASGKDNSAIQEAFENACISLL